MTQPPPCLPRCRGDIAVPSWLVGELGEDLVFPLFSSASLNLCLYLLFPVFCPVPHFGNLLSELVGLRRPQHRSSPHFLFLSLTQGRPQTQRSFQLIGVMFCDRSIEEASGSVCVSVWGVCLTLCVCVIYVAHMTFVSQLFV